jgi:alcohol dehydrogenase (cytochrome c)/quinohemoprotein ethanol dehydrogenase
VTYTIDGAQYVAISVGTGGSWAMSGARTNAKGNALPNVSRLLVYKLDGGAQLPEPAPRPARALSPPPLMASAATIARGETEYRSYCGRCHGPEGAVNYGILPDLRYSAALASKETWAAVVLGGVLKANGMASFAEVVDAEEAEAIRAWVIAQAHASQRAPSGTR